MSGEINPGGGWDGGHTFSSSAAVFGFNELIVPEVKLTHPDWDYGQVYQEALVRFNLRLSENIRYGRSETNNEDNVTVWRAAERDGTTILVIHGGAYDGYTLDQLWNNSQKFARNQGNPDAISNEEYRAQKAMQRSILSGEAGSTASIIGHPDSVKIFQTFAKGKDGLFYSHQIDLEKVAGRTLTFTEGKVLMAKIHERYQKEAVMTDAKHDHFMLENGSINAQEVRMIAQALVMTSDVIKNHPYNKRLDHMPYDTSDIVIQNIGEAAQSVYTYLSLKRKRQKEEGKNPQRYLGQKESPKQKVAIEKSISRHKKKEAKKAKKKDKLAKTVILKNKEARHYSKLKTIAYEPMRKVLETPRVRAERKKRQFRRLEQRQLFVKRIKLERVEPRKVTKVLFAKKEKRISFIKKTKERRGKFPLRSRERVKRVQSERTRARLKRSERRLTSQLVRIARRLEASMRPRQKKEVKVKEKRKEKNFLKKETRVKQRETIMKFSIAWITWILLEPKVIPEAKAEKNLKQEKIIAKEPSPWILLSIIWHLALMREGAFANSKLKTQNSKKKMTKIKIGHKGVLRSLLPQTGVIFAFGS